MTQEVASELICRNIYIYILSLSLMQYIVLDKEHLKDKDMNTMNNADGIVKENLSSSDL